MSKQIMNSLYIYHIFMVKIQYLTANILKKLKTYCIFFYYYSNIEILLVFIRFIKNLFIEI